MMRFGQHQKWKHLQASSKRHVGLEWLEGCCHLECHKEKSAFFWWRTASQKDAEKYRKYLKNPHSVVAKSSLSIPLVSLYILVVAFLIFLAASRYIALIWNCMGQPYWKDYPAFASGCSPPHPPNHSSHSRCTPFQCLGPDETGRPFSFPIPGLCNPKCLCKLQPPFWSTNRLSPTPERTTRSKHLSNLLRVIWAISHPSWLAKAHLGRFSQTRPCCSNAWCPFVSSSVAVRMAAANQLESSITQIRNVEEPPFGERRIFNTSHGGLWPLPIIGDVGILSYCAVLNWSHTEHQPNSMAIWWVPN